MALLRANPQMREGDQISILHLIQHLPEQGVPYITWKDYNFALDIISDSTFPSKFYDYIPQSLFRVSNGYIETEAGIETGGVVYMLSREVGHKMQISTQFIVLTPDNSLYQEYACEEKKKEAAESYREIVKKKTPVSKKAIKTITTKNKYFYNFILRSKESINMKKIAIALLLYFARYRFVH
ncbi:hypothetical protein EZS27_017541 [termite gut metagenome]|uniref:Uncharacterized protein n=1 Tax=termite gut metagenome TaxID=433724 RepID=A0A5J4RLY7_9ZZZZ